MSSDISINLDQAALHLQKQGFVKQPDGTWLGKLCCDDVNFSARIALPTNFPFELPSIFIDRSQLPHRIPHVESNGKICIAPSSGILIDASRPAEIVQEVLARAKNTMKLGLSKSNEGDLIEEFLAYWDHGLVEGICSICRPNGESRIIFACNVENWTGIKKINTLVADSEKHAKDWASAQGKNIYTLSECFFVVLDKAFLPPDFDEVCSVKKIINIIRAHSNAASYAALNNWLQHTRPPVTIVISIPLPENRGRGLIAIRILAPTGHAAQLAQKGWRPGTVPAVRAINFGPELPVTRLFVVRLDIQFLVQRGGGQPLLSDTTVAVIGCGSVGSHIVEHLAAIGIGRLRLIDNDVLKPENIHRHALGFNAIMANKALALKIYLGFKFPHVTVEARGEKIEDVIRSDRTFLTESNVIVAALGDETLEIWLNRELSTTTPRVHVWTEPLGIGQHVLVTGMGRNGCYECLFESDDRFGLVNKASFAEPGQSFQQSIAGCGGSFLAFSGNDSVRASVEAASLIAEILTGTLTSNVLISRFGNPDLFIQKGFRLSHRTNLFQPGHVIRESNFLRRECVSCGPTEV